MTESEIAAIGMEDQITSLDEECNLICRVSYCDTVSHFLESTRVEVEDEPSLKGQTPDSSTRRPGDR